MSSIQVVPRRKSNNRIGDEIIEAIVSGAEAAVGHGYLGGLGRRLRNGMRSQVLCHSTFRHYTSLHKIHSQ